MPSNSPPRFPQEIQNLLSKAAAVTESLDQAAKDAADYVAAFEQQLNSFPGKVAVRVDNLDTKPEANGKMPLRLTFRRAGDAWALFVDDARREVEPLDARASEDSPPSRTPVAPAPPTPVAAPAVLTGKKKPDFVVPCERRLTTEAPLSVRIESADLFPKLLQAFIAEVERKVGELDRMLARPSDGARTSSSPKA